MVRKKIENIITVVKSSRGLHEPCTRVCSGELHVYPCQINPKDAFWLSKDSHLLVKLSSVTSALVGSTVHVRFVYRCGDVAGQNMATLATHAACTAYLRSAAAKDAGVIGFQVEGQLASHKKASWGNVFAPRGVEVIALGTITKEACREVLGLDPLHLHRAHVMWQEGRIRNGQFGSNANTANVIAALFIACGQDAAGVFETGWAHLMAELDDRTQDLTFSLYIPSLLVGTVGGGTGYPTQNEALRMLGCDGTGRKWAFAETVAAFCLGLEASTIAALGNDTFAASHKNLARL